MLKIEITGPIPSKKNMLMPRKDGKGYFNPKGKALTGMVNEVLAQCGNLAPIINPKILMHFYCSTGRGDLDGKATTALDVLVKAGIIENDNLKRFKGPLVITGEIKRGVDRCVVLIEEQ